MKKMSPVVFFGTEDFSLYSLKTLIEAGFPVVAVVTKPDTKRGRDRALTQPAVKSYAEEHGVLVLQPSNLSDITQYIGSLSSPVGVLASYGKIIPQSILDLFSPGIINIHPSLLPKYRGPSPIEAAIEHRDSHTGVSIMKLVAKMDAGPIYTQAPYALDQTESKPELYNTLGLMGANLLAHTLPSIVDGSLQPTPQNESEATYCPLLSKKESLLDPKKITPGDAEARIRAHLGFPRTRMTIAGHQIIVTKAHAVMSKRTPLDIQCKNGAYLSIDELIAPTGRTMDAKGFINGYLR
ncbi:methionyl-tRNA formyltransferase [Candidatus Saccharimonas aalborgensis]|jgi:methionyl-tRNA formyltransferase|uniref:methionyl-tRNA formyltransferase n=1 Tax=Candidatus Saccharimonas aalborgensis TaxID=1332188 RepID=R4PXB7_9BACT|nr:methionyl-tRNA formyltransferase [Candidatus Saccharimonas aalborgensis]MBP7775251.1 methionyl-tRNA formyltransferase [Candidatus Saccharimonas sp.]QQR51162.1 MAG: methionyl-tRNA formyltransferase [Candidatus Saccharibacteria bacterium]AGL62412.1 methionyl-tRNA formyltransferase [Candidatus Saccharimonas aalborgensis]QQS67915.1 MAG: methionyl-tRNA formyltransferase [Candidatus Saccharibacteria bacterium]QQS70255.1 MAG: methionyl-tRNA formyltransferase [Candidatus Saccharibacteria bacterium]